MQTDDSCEIRVGAIPCRLPTAWGAAAAMARAAAGGVAAARPLQAPARGRPRPRPPTAWGADEAVERAANGDVAAARPLQARGPPHPARRPARRPPTASGAAEAVAPPLNRSVLSLRVSQPLCLLLQRRHGRPPVRSRCRRRRRAEGAGQPASNLQHPRQRTGLVLGATNGPNEDWATNGPNGVMALQHPPPQREIGRAHV